jgi:hypothetical protein
MHMRWLIALTALLTFPLAGRAEDARGTPAADEVQESIKGRIDAIEEQYNETKNDVAAAKKLKVSGYAQGRYLSGQTTNVSAVDSKGAPTPATSAEGFTVRRGRLKATYDASWSEYVLETDVVPTGVSLKEAAVALKLPFLDMAVTGGQFKWPFGYENQQSSAERELPETSRVTSAFLPGEYDRGVKLSGRYAFANFKVGLFNGSGTGYKGYKLGSDANVTVTPSGLDNDSEKDVVGRLGVDLGFFSAGVSGWAGRTFRPGFTNKAGYQAGKYYDRDRVGVDAQLYLDLVPVGGTALKAEFITGKTPYVSGIEQLDVTARGYYVLLTQFVGPKLELAARYDMYRPNADVADAVDAKTNNPLATNRIDTIGFGAVYYFDEAFKVSAMYEIPKTALPSSGGNEPKDNLFTLQVQARF